MKAIVQSGEVVEVENFLAIRSGTLSLADVTAIIGPQASGKSIFAKIIYFGRTFIKAYSSSVFLDNFDYRSFKSEQVKRFLALFGDLSGFDDPFSIVYTYGGLSVRISRASGGHKPKIGCNKILEKLGVIIRKEYTKYLSGMRDVAAKRNRPASSYYFMQHNEETKAFFESIPDVLFVPASRSFYSTISEELFTFLATEERVDQLTAQFGSFYEFAKRKVGGDWFGPNLNSSERANLNRKIRPVIDGEFYREKSKDFIKTNWGRVPLRASSSGQQEALPLLFSLMEYPRSYPGPHLLIIEEPEAHLFPTAQKYVLDLMIERVLESDCDVLFTTHSPYVLACLNNHIARLHSKKVRVGRDIEVNAYLASQGSVTSIVEAESMLIDTNYLDDVSQLIVEEFLEATSE